MRVQLMRSALLGGLTAALIGACVGDIGGEGSGGQAGGPDCAVDVTSNGSVMQGLAPTCAACHGEGTNKPFFASLAAFESLLVYDTKYVIEGDPDGSELMRLLTGAGSGTFKQMPTGGETFEARDAAGQTSITLAQVREWITDLPEPEGQNFEPLKAGTIRRMAAEHLVEQFYEPLGLTEADSFNAGGTSIDGPSLPARSPDAINVVNDYTNGQHQVYPRFIAMGGPHHLDRRLRSNDLSPTFLQSMTQMTQARCRKAVQKAGNTEFFRFADPADTSDTAAQNIRDNIGYLHLRLLGEVASAEDIDDLYNGVFLHYEPSSTESAWTATCAALLRHPLAMTY